ncbi:COMM domain-containing protein 1-like [Lytechinus variegatus]|uniref:COMM domain-containing protein 1-like n=1 Tax=Lytechinus variegatus TaxID=7654 RepID=UPI001BB1BA49|nr:COMM domain-containing protein 1-like [Lytechinus variegatus]
MADDEATATKLFGLLNGIAKRDYLGIGEITDEYMKEELFADISNEEFTTLVTKCKSLIKNVVSIDMDFNQLEAFLTSQMKKKEGGISQAQATAFTKFWRNNRSKIHEKVVSQSIFGNTLKDVSWRIDIKSQAKHIDQINMPTAIVELKLADNSHIDKDPDHLRFEMDENQLNQVIGNLEEIEKQIIAHCQ